ncbi:MAG: hypothetical protein K2L82_00350 [Lachnospiraceae bacterium]|nr:hypothetical protein [Lachnospiraceae bacterium]
MLGKLMKYEWKSTWKLLVPANLLIVVMTIIATITVRLDVFDTDNEGIIFSAIIIILTYVGSMFVVMIGTAIYLIHRFYTSTYGDQGYLLHTLPVDKHHIIIAKVLASTAWVIVSTLLMYMSILILFNEEGDIFSRMIDNVKSSVMWSGTDDVSAFAVIMTLIAGMVVMFARVLKVTACISLGQLSNNHKLLSAFGFYFLIYIIQQIVNGIYYVILGYINTITGDWYYGTTWEYSLLTGLVYSVAFYLITWHIMERKLNLD